MPWWNTTCYLCDQTGAELNDCGLVERSGYCPFFGEVEGLKYCSLEKLEKEE